MEECELCGNQMSDVYIVNVEDVEFRVCSKCARGKRVIKIENESKAKENIKVKKIRKEAEDLEIAEDYNERIRKSRESMMLPIKVLAEMINEKETLLLRIERRKTIPSMELAKKLEKALNIKLYEETTEAGETVHSKKINATLGEFIE